MQHPKQEWLHSLKLAIEYAKKNININCVSPGFIKTNMTDKIDENFKKFNKQDTFWRSRNR